MKNPRTIDNNIKCRGGQFKLSNIVLSGWWRSRGQLTSMSSLIWFWTSMKPSDTDTPPVVGDVWQHELRVLPPQPHQITTHSHLASFFFLSSSSTTYYPSCPSPPPRLPASLKPAAAPPPPIQHYLLSIQNFPPALTPLKTTSNPIHHLHLNHWSSL